MIKYLEIVEKIKDINEDVFNDFNEKVSLPLALSNLDSVVKQYDGKIIIEKNDIQIELNSETRGAFSEIISILKIIEIDLYNKIDYKYIDFFEKFKDIDYKFDAANDFESSNLRYLTLEILTIFNLKFWCENDFERKEFFEKWKRNEIKTEEKLKIEEDTIEVIEDDENLQIMKNNWWLNLLNKIRNIKKGNKK